MRYYFHLDPNNLNDQEYWEIAGELEYVLKFDGKIEKNKYLF